MVEHGRPRILVTGFCDWRELGDPPSLWRCRDNPSGRLLTGAPTHEEAPPLAGPLVAHLEEHAPGLADVALLPVTWGTFHRLPAIARYSAVIHLGLGSRGAGDRLQLENGAINLRERSDALGDLPPTRRIEETGPDVRPLATAASRRSRALAGRTLAGYTVEVAQPRPKNVFICNETLYLALCAAAAAAADNSDSQGCTQAHFVHLPRTPEHDLERLAAAVGELILALIREPH